MKEIITILLMFGVLITSGFLGAGAVSFIPSDTKRTIKRTVQQVIAAPKHARVSKDVPSSPSPFSTLNTLDNVGPDHLDLGKFVTNVQSPGRRPILMELSLSIQMKDKSAKEAAQKFKWHMRSDLNISLSNLQLAQISKKGGDEFVKKIILKILRKRLGENSIKNITILKMKKK